MTLTTVSHMSIHGQYAIARAQVTIHDGGVADLVDLEFDGGFWRRARIAPEWLRLGPTLSGRWHVTLYFRTEQDGRLKAKLYITALRRIEDGDPSSAWEAVGRVTQLDEACGRAIIRIRPSAPMVKPFLLWVITPVLLLARMKVGGFYRLDGTVRNQCPLVESIVPMEMLE